MNKIKGKKEYSAERNINTRRKFSQIFVVLLIFQIILFSSLQGFGVKLLTNTEGLQELKVDFSNAFMTDIVRAQQRKSLEAIRQGWVQYLETHPESQVLLKDDNGNPIYANIKGETLAFNRNTMELKKRTDNYFDIIETKTGKNILSAARAQWNRSEVKKILDIIATPVKAFGPTGDIIIYDAYTGEMIIDNSEDCKDTPQVIGPDGRRYLTLDHLHPNGKNPDAMKRVIFSEMMWRKDTDRGTGMVYYFSEPLDMGKDANNFELYPLGNYSREFQEKVVLPYESVGIDGQPMQIAVILGSQEPEIVAPLKEIEKEYNKLLENSHIITRQAVYTPILSVGISLIAIFLAMFSLRVSDIYCNRCKKEKGDSPQ